MKNQLSFAIIISYFFMVSCFAQSKNDKLSSKIGLTFAYSRNQSNLFIMPSYGGGEPYIDNSDFYGVGINYFHPFTKRWTLDISVEFSQHVLSMEFSSDYGFGHSYRVTFNGTPNISILSIPIGIRLNFLKYFFVNPGFVGSIDIGEKLRSENTSSDPDAKYFHSRWVRKQDGLGLYFQIGFQYEFNSGVSVFISPYSRIYDFFSEGDENLTESAVLRFGVLYNIDRLKKKHKTKI